MVAYEDWCSSAKDLADSYKMAMHFNNPAVLPALEIILMVMKQPATFLFGTVGAVGMGPPVVQEALRSFTNNCDPVWMEIFQICFLFKLLMDKAIKPAFELQSSIKENEKGNETVLMPFRNVTMSSADILSSISFDLAKFAETYTLYIKNGIGSIYYSHILQQLAYSFEKAKQFGWQAHKVDVANGNKCYVSLPVVAQAKLKDRKPTLSTSAGTVTTTSNDSAALLTTSSKSTLPSPNISNSSNDQPSPGSGASAASKGIKAYMPLIENAANGPQPKKRKTTTHVYKGYNPHMMMHQFGGMQYSPFMPGFPMPPYPNPYQPYFGRGRQTQADMDYNEIDLDQDLEDGEI